MMIDLNEKKTKITRAQIFGRTDYVELVYDRSTFGLTEPSLRFLRDQIAGRITHRIAIVRVRTDEFCAAYFIFDSDTKQIVYTGDGFRMDGGGEGGAGEKTAEIILKVFGLDEYEMDAGAMFDVFRSTEVTEEIERNILAKIATDVAAELPEGDHVFQRPINQIAGYVR